RPPPGEEVWSDGDQAPRAVGEDAEAPEGPGGLQALAGPDAAPVRQADEEVVPVQDRERLADRDEAGGRRGGALREEEGDTRPHVEGAALPGDPGGVGGVGGGGGGVRSVHGYNPTPSLLRGQEGRGRCFPDPP